MKNAIYFQEISASAAEFLHELNDPDLVRVPNLSPEVTKLLRREQVAKLQKNIAMLQAKQTEFNNRMDEYISNLRRLIQGLERGMSKDAHAEAEEEQENENDSATLVQCFKCGKQRRFHDLTVIFARESEESFDNPTHCYVSEAGKIKKGVFSCRECGSESLMIRAH